MLCAYCGERRAVNRDHVVPRVLQKKYKDRLPAELRGTVPSCFECNIRKGTRKLVPPSWSKSIPALKEIIPGKWRVWRGNPRETSFVEVAK